MVYQDPALRQALKYARQYGIWEAMADEVLESSPIMDGMPKGTATSDPVAAAAIKRENLKAWMGCIERAILMIQPQYREIVWESTVNGKKMESLKGYNKHGPATWARQKKTFLGYVSDFTRELTEYMQENG